MALINDLNYLIPSYKMGHKKFKRKITNNEEKVNYRKMVKNDISDELCDRINEELGNLYPTFLTLDNFKEIDLFCSARSKGCERMCFAHTGKKSKDGKKGSSTDLFITNQTTFVNNLIGDLKIINVYCDKRLTPVVRLNNTSDIKWENIDPKIFNDFTNIQFYDYTKHDIEKRLDNLKRNDICNYHLIYSRTEKDLWERLTDILNKNIDVAIVCKKEVKTFLLTNEKEYKGFNVIDGDIYDARVIDRKIYKSNDKGFIILLESIHKNNKKDETGFVITFDNLNKYM